MLRYSPKVFLVFKLLDGSKRDGFFRQSQRLGEVISSLGIRGEPQIKVDRRIAWLGRRMIQLDDSLSLGELGLKNDDVIEVK
jgi:hypothetical protein